MKARSISAAFLVVVNAVVTLIVGIDAVDWTDAQTGLVYVEANAVAALILAIYFHVAPARSREPVAVAATVTALAASTAALLSGFQLWHLNDAQNGLVVAVAASVVGLVTAAFAREQVSAAVTPPTPGTPGEEVNPPNGN